MYRAMALDAVERKAESLVEFRRASELAPDNPAAQDNYGRALFTRGAADAAAVQLEKARALAPYDTEVLLELANIRLAQGRSTECTALLHRVRELDPSNQEAAEALGHATSR
jgi:Flp pilus assembly protein TadD